MEWADETRSRCLLISSKDPARLKRVIAMLQAHGMQSEEGLHRPWRSASFESSVELGDGRVSPDLFDKPKQPERTDFRRYLKNRASR
jgi:hypothetical protein